MGMRRSERLSLMAIGACFVSINLANIFWTLENNDFQDSFLDRKSFHRHSEARSLVASPSFSPLKTDFNDAEEVMPKLFSRRVVDLSDLNFNIASVWEGNDKPSEDSEDECLPITRTIERGATLIIDDSDCLQQEWEAHCEPVTKSFGPTVSMRRPICNSFHELDLVDAYKPSNVEGYRTEFLGQGGYRSAFKLSPASQNNFTQENLGPELLLKLFGGEKSWQKINKAFLESVAMDSFVMEVLSPSEYVADSFGFCGSSLFTEIANETGRSIFDDEKLSSMDRLLVARDLSRGLADLHTLVANSWGIKKMGSTRPLVFAHHDIKPDNIIRSRNGQIRWNDFNLGLINRKYTHQTNTSVIECPVQMGGNNPLIRTPEELRNESEAFFFMDIEGDGRNTASQAADIYAFGNILFTLLTLQDPWTFNGEFESDSRLSWYIKKEKTLGYIPIVPERYLEEIGAKPLWEAIQMCYTLDPQGRPTALELAEFLGEAHATLLVSSIPS